MRILPLLLLGWFSGTSPVAQESCPNCLHRGVLPCKEHVDIPREEELPTAENPIVYCSWAAACPACGGTMWVDCPRCSVGEMSAEVEEKRRAIQAWLENGQLEQKLGRKVPRLETRRFALAVDVVELQGEEKGKKKLSGHALAHQLARDLEHVDALVTEHYAMTDMDYRAKMRMWLWSTREAHTEAQQKFQGTVSGGDFKVLGPNPVFSVWTEPGNFDTVLKVRANFVHNGAHMLLSNAFQSNWVGDTGGGWLDVGLGAWYEYELFGRVVNYCTEESAQTGGYENGQWRAAVRRKLEHDKDRLLPALLPKRTGQLTAEENALCWSFYDHILAVYPGAVRKLMIELKQKKEARAVLTDNLGKDLFAIEDGWREWVAATYPVQGDEPKTPKKGKKK